MAIEDGYCTLEEFALRRGFTVAEDSDRDTITENMITSASRYIDGVCHRNFSVSTAETRYFQASDGRLIFIDDLLIVTTLKTDTGGDRTYDQTWVTTDYDLEPVNALQGFIDEPYTRIRVAPQGNKVFPRQQKGVEIVGDWGYSTARPAAINEACLMQVYRLWKRKDAAFGVAGSTSFGTIKMTVPTDADIRELLKPYIKHLATAV